MKAAVIYSKASSTDLNSADNQDTYIQLQEISAILKELGIDVFTQPMQNSIAEIEQALAQNKPDFVFNLVETLNGTDGLIYLAAAFFEMLQMPYSGCSAITLAMLAGKIRQKKMLRLAKLPTADFITEVSNHFAIDVEQTDGLWIVKSNTEHASVGMNSGSVVATSKAAKLKIQQMKKLHQGEWFAERFIDGREFNISMLETGNGEVQLLPAAEIRFVNFPDGVPKIVDYEAKWNEQSAVYQGTQRCFDFPTSDAPLLALIDAMSRRCWELFDLRGAARVDFRIDADGNPWILEVNPNPCLSADAGFMAAAAQAGLSGKKVISRLIPNQFTLSNSLEGADINNV